MYYEPTRRFVLRAYIPISPINVVKMGESKELLTEIEMLNKFLVCISSLIYHGLGSYYPGLNALLFLRLRMRGIDPYVGLLSDTETYLKTLVALVGNEKLAQQLLRSILPKKKAFEKALEALLSSQSKERLETTLLNIVRKYEREIRSVCRELR
ncbi:MAG: hypothetical protein QW543_04550 [Sulfolobales archaeon]